MEVRTIFMTKNQNENKPKELQTKVLRALLFWERQKSKTVKL